MSCTEQLVILRPDFEVTAIEREPKTLVIHFGSQNTILDILIWCFIGFQDSTT